MGRKVLCSDLGARVELVEGAIVGYRLGRPLTGVDSLHCTKHPCFILFRLRLGAGQTNAFTQSRLHDSPIIGVGASMSMEYTLLTSTLLRIDSMTCTTCDCSWCYLRVPWSLKILGHGWRKVFSS